MLTYQDLQAVQNNEAEKMEFVLKAINQHKSSDLYAVAYDAEQYFKHSNVTIDKFQKALYTVTGKKVPDVWSANYKMASRYFYRFITQENQFLLGNGVTWKNESTKSKLETERYKFDTQLQKAGEKALVMGVSFGFFNLDHLEVFDVLEFAPLYDEVDGSLSAGVRFWQVADDKPLRATLYEIDGYTEYMWDKDEKAEIVNEKRAYKLKLKGTEAEGSVIYDGENYLNFPIVPLWGNWEHQSEIVGLREQIDCYDLIKSGFANTVDEASIMYWTITNAGGMDEIDLAKFVERLKTIHAVTMDDQAQVQAHNNEPPYNSREALLNRLETDLYKDAMALNTANIATGSISVTATQIRAAYEPLNSKTDKYEYCVLDFLNEILLIAGITDEAPSFTRSTIINVAEEVQTVIQASSYLDSDYVTRKILTILGDGDKADEVLKAMETDDISRFGGMTEDEDEGLGGEANG